MDPVFSHFVFCVTDFCIDLVPKVYLDGVVTVVDSKNCLTQMKGGGDPNASGGLSDWLRQVLSSQKQLFSLNLVKGWGGRSDCGEQE